MTIAIHHASVAFGDKVVLDDCSLTLPERGVAVLFGPSGCGKSTLLDVLSGLLTPTTGAVIGLEGATIARVFQDNRFLSWSSVEANVACVLTKRAMARVADDERLLAALSLHDDVPTPDSIAIALLTFVGLEREAAALPETLSGGMQKRLGLARVLGADAEVVLLDEPTVGLDEAAAIDLLDRCMALWDDRLVVLVTHDHSLAVRYGTTIQEVSGPPLTLDAPVMLR